MLKEKNKKILLASVSIAAVCIILSVCYIFFFFKETKKGDAAPDKYFLLPALTAKHSDNSLALSNLSITVNRFDPNRQQFRMGVSATLTNTSSEDEQLSLYLLDNVHNLNERANNVSLYIDGEEQWLNARSVSLYSANPILKDSYQRYDRSLFEACQKATYTAEPLNILEHETIEHLRLKPYDGETIVTAELRQKGQSSFKVISDCLPATEHNADGSAKITFNLAPEQDCADIFILGDSASLSSQAGVEVLGDITFDSFKDIVLKNILQEEYRQELSDNYRDNLYYCYMSHLNNITETDGIVSYGNFKEHFYDYTLLSAPIEMKKNSSISINYTTCGDAMLPSFKYFAPDESYFDLADTKVPVVLKNAPPREQYGFKMNGGVYSRTYDLKDGDISFSIAEKDYVSEQIKLYFVTIVLLVVPAAYLILYLSAMRIKKLKARAKK